MIIKSISTVPGSQANSLTWLRLRRFQNVPYVTGFLMDLHQLPAGFRSNAKKQAEQIRFCLIQAEEYFVAARAVSLATKPLLTYYGVMSFALAEILLKQSGDSSLDRARAEHAHHGLILKQSKDPSKYESLADSAGSLIAAPMINGATRQGTFDLWHRSARETPAVGKRTTSFAANTEEGSDFLLSPSDKRFELIPVSGRTLLSVISNLPGMEQTLRESRLHPNIVRAIGMSTYSAIDHTFNSTIVFHPGNPNTLASILDLVSFSPNAFPNLIIEELARGYRINWNAGPDLPMGECNFPQLFQRNVGEIKFTTEDTVNEFGLIYLATYILGNYARYFPDQWMREVETASALSLAASTLVDIALDRAPFLTMCELGRVWYVET